MKYSVSLFVFQILCDEILSEFEAADYSDQVSKQQCEQGSHRLEK